ncbi:MAG: cyclase family protein [Candidatus Brocadia sp.]|jgi:Predicted metal-dependent hydrolase|uniref:Cyclase n=1 Tax=Candidatus Brocadia fulgida TaxID=380242 RepID=A0A0M2V296_9BACT|nr:MAG: putative cyclase [Candidatus Brocadia fulgida]UJS22432.1 MAG: cyclase family protein [Candidatus Brocadia sp.]
MKNILRIVTFGIMLIFWKPCLQAGILEDVMEGKATVIDLTYPLNEKNPYWPVGNYTPFRYEVIANIKRDMVFSGRYSTPEHLGTHLDAPNHFELNRPSVDQIPFEQLVGPAVMIDITDKAGHDHDYALLLSDVEQWEKVHGRIPDGSMVLLHTGWCKRWYNFEDYKNKDTNGSMHFPGYSKEAAIFLVEKRNVKGVGIDTLSGDCGNCSAFQVHHVINGAGKFMLENVANLDKLPPRGFTLIVAPIKIEGGSGGQCRIWALVPQQTTTEKH